MNKTLNAIFKPTAIMGLAAGLFINALSFGGSLQAQTLKLGTEGAYPPFNSIDENGKLVGFDIEIGDAICAQMQRECEWVVQDWDGMIPALLARKYDAIIASMSVTEDRKKVIDFTRPYYNTPAKFIAKAGAFASDAPSALKGKRVGVQRASIHQSYIEDMYPDSELVLYATQEEANLDLVAGRVDAVMADSIVLNDGFIATDAGTGFAFFGDNHSTLKHHGIGVGIGVRKGDADLRDDLSKAIEAIYANGTYQKINDKYFDFSVWTDAK